MCWWDQLSSPVPRAGDLFTTRVYNQSAPVCGNREKPRVSTVMRLGKGSQTLIFHWVIIATSHYYSWKTYCSSRVCSEISWLAVGTSTRLSWKSHVEGLPVSRSFLPRKLLEGLKYFITFPQLHWTTWISQGCRFEFFLPVCIPEWSEEEQ